MMIHVKLNRLISLGLNLRYWQDYSEGHYETWLKGEKKTQVGLLDSMNNAIETLNELNICKKTAKEIEEFVGNIDKKYSHNSLLDADDKNLLSIQSALWYDRIKNDLENLNVMFADYKYLLNLELLIEGAKDFFRTSVWRKLKRDAKKDLNECCKCILFELPTSAGIMALRATESVLRNYYKAKTSNSVATINNWNQILQQLRATSADKSLLGHLDYLRKNLRNTLAHPEAVLSQKDAENIFPMIVTTIEAMIQDT